ncbi:uncharacterized protein LOC124542132 [Vanessa cardui]|uniref:uncharacterized protein LOC124542132 n=1 Tax=Vanessa cardui TaxID=171605 RepID=UPI001F1421E6|nr:uncharacterized protein LOC124542132 [Vanessa cardui]
MSEWSEDKCLMLIDAYKENTVLWNPIDKDYYKKHLKEDAWAKIGGIMNESGGVCKQKMINLLASYRRARMKIKKSVGTGKGKDEIYESKWYAFKVLGFLNDRFTPRKGLVETQMNR